MQLVKEKFNIGQRISNRGEDFIITDIQENKNSHILTVEGLSELVKSKTFIFDTHIETCIKPIDPRHTQLIKDTDYGYRKTKLFIENQLRNASTYNKQISIAHKAAFNMAKYQLEPTLKAFELPRPRILIADGVGLGKTVEVGIFLAEMIKRGKGKRIMVLALKSILAQFQQELWNRFAIPLVRLDSYGIAKIKSELPLNKNPFEYYDKTIISIDTLKNNAKFQHYIENTSWDIIVIDECHTVANSSSLRGSLAQLLSSKCESLVLTSATPHNGRKESFANLINMIEPLAIKDENDYSKEDILPYYVRRFKNDIDEETVRANFQDRQVIPIHAQLSTIEEDFLRRQQEIKLNALKQLDEHEVQENLFGQRKQVKPKKDLLFAIGLFKSYMSSPEAAYKSIENRIAKLEEVNQLSVVNDTIEDNIDALRELLELLVLVIDSNADAKYNAFKNQLIKLKWNGRTADPRIVVFAERIETLNTLKTKLKKDFDLDDKVIADFNGSLSDIEQQQIIEDFGKADSNYRILLTSDAGSQGVNLHYYCNHMFNYDIPWSLITLEQRNGRIDRYGQSKTPHIYYMIANSELEGLKDDLHIVAKLKDKEENVYQSLGDAASVYKLYDATKEENFVTKAIATQNIELLDTAVEDDANGFNFGDDFWDEPTLTTIQADPISENISLFRNDRLYYEDLITQLKTDGYLKMDDAKFEGDILEVKHNDMLNRILYDLPPEAKPDKGGVYQLSLDVDDVQKAIADARRKKGEWAQFQILYDLHPIIKFFMTQLEASVDKDVALVSKLSRLPKETAYFLVHGQSANNKGQALLSDFFVVPMRLHGGLAAQPLAFNEFIEKYNLSEDLYTEEIADEELNSLQELLPDAITFADELHMKRQQDKLQAEMQCKQAVYEEKMKNWKTSKYNLLNLKFADMPTTGLVEHRRRNQVTEIETILSISSQYFKDLTSLNGAPYLKVLAVFYNNK